MRRLCSRSLLVMMCVTSVSFSPCAMATGPRVAYKVTTVKFNYIHFSYTVKTRYNGISLYAEKLFYTSIFLTVSPVHVVAGLKPILALIR